MIKLTRLNRHIVALNPDLVVWLDALPDTTLSLVSGEKVIVRESVDEVIDRIVAFRRASFSRPPTLDEATATP